MWGFAEKYVELFIAKSKTDIYRNGNVVVLAKTGHITCPFSLLSRYVQVGNIDLTELNWHMENAKRG